MAVTTYAPASGSTPAEPGKAPAGAMRFGPVTAPIVEPHTTKPMADARRSGRARSAAT